MRKIQGILSKAQTGTGIATPPWRRLSRRERRILKRNGNLADDWNNLFVTDGFSPASIRNSTFYGVNRFAGQSKDFLEYHGLKLPVGISNSTIVSCEIGNDAAIHNVAYLSRYQVGSQVMLFNIDEMVTTTSAVFGSEWIAVGNENGGRRILSFAGINVADAYLWSRHRDRPKLQEKLQTMTQKVASLKDGKYGRIGDGTVIKSCRIVKDIETGECTTIQGANKLQNLTIHSNGEVPTEIGEGVELENGVIDFGSRVSRGVKAIRFYLGTNTTVENGARFIDSVLGDNSTVSCCEVISSITFPFHELHHNNSFLISATLQGLSNIGAGATIGSNHNSRAADGEFLAGRGFWPGLSVNLKLPSKLASFCLVAKGSYPAELNIPLPFTLVSNDEKDNHLQLYPGYWFIHNMYGLGRDSWKLKDRDPGLNPALRFEHDYLAPDTVEELLDGLEIMEKWAGRDVSGLPADSAEALRDRGRKNLENGTVASRIHISPVGVEASTRGVVVLHIDRGYKAYREMIHYYGVRVLLLYMRDTGCTTLKDLLQALPDAKRTPWINLGGQLVTKEKYTNMIAGIEDGAIDSWDSLHQVYRENAGIYPVEKARHALSALLYIHATDAATLTVSVWNEWVSLGMTLQAQVCAHTIESRRKDYQSEFRKMMYETDEEMNAVLGDLKDNQFIKAIEGETEELARLAGTLGG
jgi:hypothetical protein